MQVLENLGLGMNIILGMIAGVLIGATYALYQTIHTAREAGQGTADIVRHYGVFVAAVLMLWLTFISYAYLQWQKAATTAAVTTSTATTSTANMPVMTGVSLLPITSQRHSLDETLSCGIFFVTQLAQKT